MENQNIQPLVNQNPVKPEKTGEVSQAKSKKGLISFLPVFLVLIIAAGLYFFFKSKYVPSLPFIPKPSPVSKKIGFEKFASEEEFKTYLREGAGAATEFFGVSQRMVGDLGAPMVEMAPKATGMGEPERVSETTVQVKGIDEPDIVKTDGKEIYFSSKLPVYRPLVEPGPLLERRVISPPQTGETKVIKAFPPADLAKEGEIEKTGDLLLIKDVLVLFTNDNKIYGYDVSDPKLPTEKWKVELEDNNFLVDARLYQGKVYFVTRTRINTSRPCPIVPLSFRGNQFSISCTDIYHPVINVPVDVTYTAFILDPSSGEINKNVSFVGSSGLSVIFMSQNSLYTTYSYYEDMIDFLYEFFKEKCQDLFPESLIEKLDKLRGYDISNQAKMVEFNTILEQHKNSLSNDERLKMENEFTNRMKDYYQEHMREVEKTGIVKIDLDDFKVLATASIPGRPLNQFSLDEYKDHLRVATTVSGGRTFGAAESANDVYILDSKLKQVGSIFDLGLGERVYSARFIEDKGYLVTFKQIDPFFVLDLSDPKNPQVKGELKIPGYSSYLHPISKDKILGIGKEGSKIKVSLFDVSSADNPAEVDKYTLDEYWSDILTTHHAFLLDKDNEVFFLPGSKGGYIFSYKKNELSLTKAVADIRARRAVYINNYLYIIGEDELVVLNEADWEQVNQLEL